MDEEKNELIFRYTSEKRLSFITIAEDLIESPKTRQPFLRICGLMREADLKTCVIHKKIHEVIEEFKIPNSN